MSDLPSSISDDLLHIYSSLRKLGCIKSTKSEQTDVNKIDASIFSRKFLFKLIDERLADLDEYARKICEDLFKQIGVKPKKVEQTQIEQEMVRVDSEHELVRYPEFDEYFYRCVYYLYDFFIELKWHEVEVDQLSKQDYSYVAKHLKNIEPLLKFHSQLVDPNTSPLSPNKREIVNQQTRGSTSPVIKSSLGFANKTPGAKSTSPTMRRRVRFEKASSTEYCQSQAKARQRKLDDYDLRELHSIFALDLLIHSINNFMGHLENRFLEWTSSTRASLTTSLEYIFDSNRRIRSKQLQLVAKSFKISLDVHLTVLDYLNEIKSTYLIHKTFEVICARDTSRIVVAYKKSRVSACVHRCLEIERRILASLTIQGLQLFFGLIVCEINHPPVELNGSLTPKSRDEANKSHDNMLSFLTGWLQVEDVLFGYSRAKQKTETINRNDLVIKRPKILSKSTLSLDSTYASSSRIMVQMENLCDFLKTYLSLTTTRLRHSQQIRYFLDHIATGLSEFFEIVSDKIKSQLAVSKTVRFDSSPASNAQTLASEKSTGFEIDKNCMAAKIRSLKLLHITNSAERLLEDEIKRAKIKLASLERLSTQIQKFWEICFPLEITRAPRDKFANDRSGSKH